MLKEDDYKLSRIDTEGNKEFIKRVIKNVHYPDKYPEFITKIIKNVHFKEHYEKRAKDYFSLRKIVVTQIYVKFR